MLILMQGIPGSGKSTLARQLAQQLYGGAIICSTDDFHYDSGEYVFDHENVVSFHYWNQWEVDHWLASGRHVIVDNTNILRAHAQPYIDLARKHKTAVKAVRCTGNWQSVHPVPAEIIERMRQTMENLF